MDSFSDGAPVWVRATSADREKKMAEKEPLVPEENGGEEKLKLTVKAAQRKLEVELSEDATVKEVGMARERVAGHV